MIQDQAFIDFINKHFIKIRHRSVNSSSESTEYSAISGIGLWVENIICHTFTICVQDVDEKDLTHLASSVKREFLQRVLKNFPQTEVYKNVDFGLSMPSQEKNTEACVLSIFHYYLGALSDKDLFGTISFFVRNLYPIKIASTKDAKTLLQEYYQKHGKGSPQYITTQDVTAPQHAPIFESKLTFINGKTFSGLAGSRKKAEQKVATEICDYLRIIPKERNLSLLKDPFSFSSYIETTFYTPYRNQTLNKVFGLSTTFNTIQAFVPPRHKGKHSREVQSHRKLAILGSVFIQLLSKISLLEIIKQNPDLNPIGASLSTSELMNFYHSGMLSQTSLPFKNHEDFQTQAYLVDCIQALYAFSFICMLRDGEKLSNESILDRTLANKWIFRKIKNINAPDAKQATASIVLKKLQKYGFQYKLIRTLTNYRLEIKHIRTNGIFNIDLRPTIENRKEAMERAASSCLRALDRLEGLYLEEPVSRSAQITQKQLISFFIYNLTKDNLPSQISDDEFIWLKEENSKLARKSTKELKEEWECSNKDSIADIALLFELHKRLDLIDTEINLEDYLSLPICSYQTSKVKRLVVNEDQTNLDDSFGPSVSVRILPSTLSNKREDEASVQSPVSIENQNSLNQIFSNYENMEFDVLLQLWKDRQNSFKYREEAAFVLSKIRYEKGIDLQKASYQQFLNLDVIDSLDLPLFNEKAVNFQVNSNSQGIDEKTEKFTIKPTDQRIKKTSTVTVRVGQSDFRQSLINLWGQCAFSGCKTLKVLDAAHIYPYRGEKDNDLRNGLLLRTDLHRLFDNHLISVNPDTLQIHVSPLVTDTLYTELHGRQVVDKIGLSKEALEYHWLYFISAMD